MCFSVTNFHGGRRIFCRWYYAKVLGTWGYYCGDPTRESLHCVNIYNNKEPLWYIEKIWEKSTKTEIRNHIHYSYYFFFFSLLLLLSSIRERDETRGTIKTSNAMSYFSLVLTLVTVTNTNRYLILHLYISTPQEKQNQAFFPSGRLIGSY